jgi:hypothetical protein
VPVTNPGQPNDRYRRFVLVLALVGSAVVVGILAVVIAVVVGTLRPNEEAALPSPEPVVSRYLTAIESGDLATASALDAAARNDFSDYASFDHGDVLADAADRISAFTVSASPSKSTSREVSVTYTLAGETLSDQVTVHWIEASGEWRLESSLIDLVSVTAAVGEAGEQQDVAFTANGQRTAADPNPDASGAASYAMYPGIYSIRPVVESGTAPAAQTVTVLSRNVDTGGTLVTFPAANP